MGLHRMSFLMSFYFESMAHRPCSHRGTQAAHFLARDASRCPHLDLICCHQLPVDHPWFRPVVAEPWAGDGCPCGARGSSSCKDMYSTCCKEIGVWDGALIYGAQRSRARDGAPDTAQATSPSVPRRKPTVTASALTGQPRYLR